jgi:hypothetical protein
LATPFARSYTVRFLSLGVRYRQRLCTTIAHVHPWNSWSDNACTAGHYSGHATPGLGWVWLQCVVWPRVHTLKDCNYQMRNLDSCRRWRCILCPLKVRNNFFIHFWNRTILFCMPFICIDTVISRLSFSYWLKTIFYVMLIY